MGREKDVFLGLEVELIEDGRGLNLWEYLTKDFCHRGANNVGVFWFDTWLEDVATSVLWIAHVDIGGDINDSADYLLRKVLVLTTVTCLHVEDRYLEALCGNNGEAWVGIAKDDDGIRLNLYHEVVSLGDDIAHGLANVLADYSEVVVGFAKAEVFEEDFIEVVIVVLAGVNQNVIKIFICFLYDGWHFDYLWAGAHDSHQF